MSFHIAKWNTDKEARKGTQRENSQQALHITWWRDQNFNTCVREREG